MSVSPGQSLLLFDGDDDFSFIFTFLGDILAKVLAMVFFVIAMYTKYNEYVKYNVLLISKEKKKELQLFYVDFFMSHKHNTTLQILFYKPQIKKVITFLLKLLH